MSVREERRAKLRADLIDIAYRKIGQDGLSSVTARYLSSEAGCALGAIYNMFEDMNQLFMQVNMRSFEKLARGVALSLEELSDPSPHEQLNALAQTYLEYALANQPHWLALFDINMNVESNVPKIYQDSLASLLALIATPMADVFPNKSEAEVKLITQTVFSSIHGIVLLGVQKRLSAVPADSLREMIRFLIYELGDAT